ncbi:Biotin/lipoate A/B protein ligase [Allomyces javanicus]|nr:Biotin/lipoate A/B protein ligase [Allomyces javanicus]
MAARDIRCFISRITDPFVNLAVEEWLFRTTPVHSHVLLLWRNSSTVVIGRNQNQWKECNVHALEADNIPWVRRKSGGGTVYHDLGNSIYSIIEPRESFTRRKNAELVTRALHHLDVPAAVNDRHDIVVDGRKVSGSAFKLTSRRAYHHGTMLIDANLTSLRKYLKIDRPRLVTKGVPSVPSPVTNLREFSMTVDHTGFCEAVVDEFRRAHDLGYLTTEVIEPSIVDTEPHVKAALDELTSDEWRLGQTPEFTHEIHLDHAILNVHCRGGQVTAASCQWASQPDDLLAAGLEDFSQCLIGQYYHPKSLQGAWARFVTMQNGAIQETHPTMVELRQFVHRLGAEM